MTPKHRPGHDIIISPPEQWTSIGMQNVCEMAPSRSTDRLKNDILFCFNSVKIQHQ